MSVKKQILKVCKPYTFEEEIPEEFLDETDVDSSFYRNILDIFQSQHRIVGVSKDSNKMSFTLEMFQFCELKKQPRFVLQEEVIISERELSSLVDCLSDFRKTFDTASKCLQFSSPKPKNEYGSTKSKKF